MSHSRLSGSSRRRRRRSPEQSHRFEVVLQPSATDAPIVLRSAADPNQATLAFHEELQRLMTQGVAGELAMRNHQHGRTPILRQPLVHPTSPPERNRRK